MDPSDSTPPVGFAERMTELKRTSRKSFRDLERLTNVDDGYLTRMANGTRPAPTESIARAIGRALGAEDELVELARREHAPPAAARPEPLGDREAAQARATLTHLVGLDTLHGSHGLVPFAVRSFRVMHDKLATVGGTDDARAAVADLGAAAAWITSDAVQRDESKAIALEAYAQADLAGDERLRRFLLSHLSMVSEHAGRYGDALAYADKVLRGDLGNSRVQAVFEVRRARALSGLGDIGQALDAWEHAEHLLTETPAEDDGLTYWVHSAEMSLHKAVILTRGSDSAGFDWARRAIELLPDGQGRDQVLWRAMLLHDAVSAHAWKEVPGIVDDLMRFAGDTRSARVPEQLRTTWNLLERLRPPARVRDAVRAARDAFPS